MNPKYFSDQTSYYTSLTSYPLDTPAFVSSSKSPRSITGAAPFLHSGLEISLAALKDKPDRADLQKLYVLDKAAALMTERAPGFAPAWQAALKEAQAELDKTATGLLPWIRRVIHPAASARASLPPSGEGADEATPPPGA